MLIDSGHLFKINYENVHFFKALPWNVRPNPISLRLDRCEMVFQRLYVRAHKNMITTRMLDIFEGNTSIYRCYTLSYCEWIREHFAIKLANFTISLWILQIWLEPNFNQLLHNLKISIIIIEPFNSISFNFTFISVQHSERNWGL